MVREPHLMRPRASTREVPTDSNGDPKLESCTNRPGSRSDLHTRLESSHLAGNLLGDPSERDLFVHLSAGYEESDRRYPAVYLFHGTAPRRKDWRVRAGAAPGRRPRRHWPRTKRRMPVRAMSAPVSINRWTSPQSCRMGGAPGYRTLAQIDLPSTSRPRPSRQGSAPRP